MSSLPLVSVLMTAYNREQFIAEAIESVLANSYANLELIVVDDRSADTTAAIARRFTGIDKRVRFYVNEKNLGDYPNRNRAAALARGKYIVFTDSDDWMFKDALIAWVDVMEQKKAEFGIFMNAYVDAPTLLSPATVIRSHFFKKPLLMYGPGATIITNDYFKRINGFPEKYGPANDMYYNLKAASQTHTLIFPFPLNDYRRHEGQEINNRYSYLYNNYLYLNEALNELDLALTQKELNYLSAMNKRRFVANCFLDLKTSKDLKRLIAALRKTRFSAADFFRALYIKSLPVHEIQ